MIAIKSFVKYSKKTIKDLDDIQKNPFDYFVPIEDIGNFIKALDEDYVEGVIVIKNEKEEIITFRHWDLVDQLWSYLLNLVKEVLEKKEGEMFFPDQPIKLEMKEIYNNCLLLTIDNSSYQLVMNDFFKKIIESAEIFFRKLSEYDKFNKKYIFELNLINELKKELNEH